MELTGWKRFETNRVIRFAGVTEDTFHSIFRRSLVIEYKARFYTEQHVLEHHSSIAAAAALGVFPRDPTLKDFLKSGPCVVASLRLLLGWMAEKTEQQRRETIENYAVHGGDGGLTEATMRAACGLSLQDVETAHAAVTPGGMPAAPPPSASGAAVAKAGAGGGGAQAPQDSAREQILKQNS